MTEFAWDDKIVLVTGGTGFLASHLIEQLIEYGSHIIVLDICYNPKSYFFINHFEKDATMLYVDIKDKDRVFDIISKYNPEIVFHLAAQTIVPTAYLNPAETLYTNVMGTVNILEGARLFSNFKAIVVASSDKAYGISDTLPYIETNKIEGKYPYDVSKSCTDLISSMYFFSYNLPVIITRMANMFGPGDLQFSRIIPATMTSIIKNQPLNIRSDGSPIREYIYVKDVVSGFIRLAENITRTKGEAFNLASDVKFSVLELVNRISLILDQKVDVNILNTAKAEIPTQYLSYEKINKRIGWKPEYSFEEGIRRTYQWYKHSYFNERKKS